MGIHSPSTSRSTDVEMMDDNVADQQIFSARVLQGTKGRALHVVNARPQWLGDNGTG